MGYNEVRKDDYDVIQERMVNLQYVTFIVREDDFQKRHYIYYTEGVFQRSYFPVRIFCALLKMATKSLWTEKKWHNFSMS
jgi:hypothetical protein